MKFLLAGPGDVIGLEPDAISQRYPTPGALDHESDRCPHVEFADVSAAVAVHAGAPSRRRGTGNQHPWLVLVVGPEPTELTVAGDQVT